MAGLGDPRAGHGGVIGVHDAVAVQRGGVVPGGHQRLFELPARGHLQQLRRRAFFAGQAHRQRANGTGVATFATHDVALQHQATAHKGADVDVEKAAQAASAALQQFGHTGGHRVFGEHHWQIGERLHSSRQVDALPSGQRLRGLATEHIAPLVQRQRRGQAQPHHPAPGLAPARLQRLQALGDLAQQALGVGVVVAQFKTVHRLATKIGHQQLQVASAHLHPHAVGAIGVERQRHRGLPHLAAHPLLFEQQAVVEQAVDDDRHRLARQLGQARQVGFGHGAVQANGLQHGALVELAHAVLVGAAHLARRRGGVGVQAGIQ